MADRNKMIKGFVAKTDPFGFGNLTAGQRIKRGRDPKRITEDDPRWNGKTMGNKRYRENGFIRQG